MNDIIQQGRTSQNTGHTSLLAYKMNLGDMENGTGYNPMTPNKGTRGKSLNWLEDLYLYFFNISSSLSNSKPQ